MVLAQAVLATRDGLRPSREGLVVQPGVRGGPVQVLASQHVATELAVVCHPVRPLIIVRRTENRRLVRPELRGLFRELGDEECRHTGIALKPQLDICDRRSGGGPSGWLARLGCQRVSSPQISALSSTISTNSRSRIFFAVFGGTVARGLYGPGDDKSVDVWESKTLVVLTRDVDPTTLVVAEEAAPLEEIAAAARRSRPVGREPAWEKSGM